MPKPICFMVMPFGVKLVEPRVDGAPDKIDFDALWNKGYLPVIQEDDHLAAVAAQVARLACERDARNEWSKPALLTLAFFDQNVGLAKDYAKEVRRAGPQVWKLDTLERSVGQTTDADKKKALEAILADLKSLLK